MEDHAPHPRVGAFICLYKTANPPFLWVIALFAVLFVLLVFWLNKMPLWAVGILAAPMSFLPIGFYAASRFLRTQSYIFYESGFVQLLGSEPPEVPYSSLKGIAMLTVVQVVSPVPVASVTSSLTVFDDKGRRFRASVSKGKLSKSAAAEYEKAKALLVNSVRKNIASAIDAGGTVPWTHGLSLGRGLNLIGGDEIPWPTLRFSIMNGRCIIFGPSGKIARVGVGEVNSAIAFELARAGGSEFEYPRSSFAMNRNPTTPAGFPISPIQKV